MPAPTWFLRTVKLSNILGFLGHTELKFGDGLQVIEAPNHTGKTSLAISLLWGLTGQLPSVERISAGQFKLKNKLASNKEIAEVDIVLENNQNEKLLISRSTNSTANRSHLVVKFNENVYSGDKAQETILTQLGLKPQSLEGCSIVLQDQRLSLIAGDLKKSSAVIHDILGLSVLSKLVPIIKEKLTDLNKIIKDFEDLDPLKKWEERHASLNDELNVKENEAIVKGYPKQFFHSNFLANEFKDLCHRLEMENCLDGRSPKETVDILRKALARKRDQNPSKNKRDQLAAHIPTVAAALKKICDVKTYVQDTEKKYLDLRSQYHVGLQEIAPTLQKYAAEILAKQAALDLLKEQNGLFSHSLSLLKKQGCGSSCPLCQQPVDQMELLREIEAKLGDTIKKSMVELENEIKQLTAAKQGIENLKMRFNELQGSLGNALNDSIHSLNPLGERYKDAIVWIQQNSAQPLSNTRDLLSTFENLNANIHKYYSELNIEHDKAKMMSLEYDQSLMPLENKLDNCAMYLIPIHDIHVKLLEHDKSKAERVNKGKAHGALLDSTKGYLKQLEELKTFLQNQEKDKANQVIAGHQDFVTDFFVKVAGNPHYDRIAITAEENRGSVKYDFEASSTKNASFTDAAKHVLSGSDLSVACLGLVLSLTKGKSNKTGFMVLDDPGESFDTIRMDNFAKAIQTMPGHQTIILTHQRDFADKLRRNGADSISL